MGQKAAPGAEPGSGTDGTDGTGEKKLDLSVAQIAGSSLATVAAALLASKLGVYGTILGAGVVSVVATAGGPVIQHLFKRTGDQLRESARPRARQIPLPREEKAADGTLLLRAVPPSEEFGEATVHGTRVRGWKRTAVASGTAFAIALGGLGAYEAFSGTAISQGGGTIWSGGTRKVNDERPAGPGKEPGAGGKGGGTPESGTSPSPSAPHGGRGPSTSTDPGPSSPDAPDPSGSAGSESGSPALRPSPPAPSPKPTPTPTPTPTPAPSGKGQQDSP
ncbi:hypothetical protein [Streptomyces sp. NBC_01296]|uniref:hypothetical protein n=1 Tax=Streptomyces sp. NBC_01296 TaxID=2903816 RepID=UPI002E0EB4F4|nr:hypothetical protein OG299_11355 [Streptomyces sp. NBC_01296]WSW62343.1 hypothetical protein OG513_29270 [Streptomyces sp. NBC_00998]